MRTQSPRYSKAPVVEAIIDLRISGSASLQELEKLCDRIREDYPHREPIYLYSGEVKFDTDAKSTSASSHHSHVGYKAIAQDQKHTAHLRLDGFALQESAPYSDWDSFCREARRVWNLYTAEVEWEGVTRAAVRYINCLSLPSENLELEKYLQTCPLVSKSYPQETISGFFLQLKMPQNDLGAMAVLNMAPAPPSKPSCLNVIVDFDLSAERTAQLWNSDQQTELWEYLEKLRLRKNELFEATITDATRRLIS